MLGNSGRPDHAQGARVGQKRRRRRQKAVLPGPPTSPADVVADFPRGRPDGNRHEPVATARWISTEDAGRVLDPWRPGHFLLGRDAAGRYLGVSDDRHILTVSGSRAGKGVSLVAPNLLFWPGSVLAIDPKGELASLTASRRSAVGSAWSLPMTPGEGEVHALDPFERVTGPARQFSGGVQSAGGPGPGFRTGAGSRLDDRRCARDPVAGRRRALDAIRPLVPARPDPLCRHDAGRRTAARSSRCATC